MAIVEFTWNPSTRELKVFSALLIVFSAAVAFVVYHKTDGMTLPVSIAATGTVLGITGLLLPGFIRYVYVAWMVAVSPIAIVVSNTVMAIAFFGVVWPTAALLRLKHRDALLLKFDRDKESYWQEREPARDPGSYFRQF